jgi:hypothetical protein
MLSLSPLTLSTLGTGFLRRVLGEAIALGVLVIPIGFGELVGEKGREPGPPPALGERRLCWEMEERVGKEGEKEEALGRGEIEEVSERRRS